MKTRYILTLVKANGQRTNSRYMTRQAAECAGRVWIREKSPDCHYGVREIQIPEPVR